MSGMILYEALEKDFTSMGLGVLTDAMNPKVQQRLNGEFELTFKYPAAGAHFADIKEDAYVVAKPDPESKPQQFRIYKTTAVMRGYVTVLARHKAYNLIHTCVSPFTASSAATALQALQDKSVGTCPFTFWTDKMTAANMSVPIPSRIWDLLGGSAGSILDVYGGEYEFDNNIVKLWNHRGSDRGVTIRYGKNLVDLQQERNIANMVTGVYPFWAGKDGEIVELPEKITYGPGVYPERKSDPLDLTEQFETKPSVEQLRHAAEEYIKTHNVGKPEVSIKIKFLQLEQTEEYKDLALLERVALGDTVTVKFPPMGVDVKARVVATEFDPIRNRYITVTLGRVRASLASTISGQGQQIADLPNRIEINKSDIEQAVDDATAWLTNGKGYKVERRDADGNIIDTLYMDRPNIKKAVHVLRIGQSGIGFSAHGVNGPYSSAWTIAGKFNASFITTGVLSAALIKAGLLTDGEGNFSLDMTSGVVKITKGQISMGPNGQIFFKDDGTGNIGPLKITKDAVHTDTVTIKQRSFEIRDPATGKFGTFELGTSKGWREDTLAVTVPADGIIALGAILGSSYVAPLHIHCTGSDKNSCKAVFDSPVSVNNTLQIQDIESFNGNAGISYLAQMPDGLCLQFENGLLVRHYWA